MKFAMELKDRRMARNWSQKQLAIKTGINRQTIAAYETGRIQPSLQKFYLICSAFKINEGLLN